MKKIIVSIIVIGLLLTTSIASVNAFDMEEEAGELETSGPYFHAKLIADVYVDDDADPDWYDETHVKTIKEGIDVAEDGDTVYVYSGIYYEKVKVDKTIDLMGEDKDTTFIDGSGFDYVVKLSADSVNINGFTLQNSDEDGIYLNSDYNTIYGNIIKNNQMCGIRTSGLMTYNYNTIIIENTITDNSIGIDACSAIGYIISDNTIINTKYEGIILGYTTDSIVTGNTIVNFNLFGDDRASGIILAYYTNNNTISGNTIDTSACKCNGIRLFQECSHNNIVDNTITGHKWGIKVEHGSSHNNISENTITNNIEDGIYLRASFWSGSGIRNNVFLGNTITDNNCGIHLTSEGENITDNTFSENNITDNTYGIRFDGFSPYGGEVYDNTIYYNNFENNGGILIGGNAKDAGSNTWDDGEAMGNYWDDYHGLDLNPRDGIGDKPYDIPGGDNQDRFPLKGPYPDAYSAPYPRSQTNPTPSQQYSNSYYLINADKEAQLNDIQGVAEPRIHKVLDGNGDYTTRGSIDINGNDEFDESNGVTGGSGTEFDPYIIEDWELPGISISDTTAYFVIRHCYLTEIDDPYDNYYGVRLKNVKNGAIQESIFHPEKDNSGDGIYLENSNSNVINSCIISNCGNFGIRLDTSSDTIIKNCNISYCGREGIRLDTSNDNVIDNCTISNCVYHAGINMIDSNNNTIHNCTISYCTWRGGINLIYSNDNIISNCEILKCDEGIALSGSSYNVIHSCNVSECSEGIKLTPSRGVMSEGNIIYHNNFFENYFITDPVKIRCNAVARAGCLNQWDNGEEGNYWDDYHGLDLDGDGIGNQPYSILDDPIPWGRPTGNRDRYPLMGPYPNVKSRQRSINSPLLKLLEQSPNSFPILRLLLRLPIFDKILPLN